MQEDGESTHVQRRRAENATAAGEAELRRECVRDSGLGLGLGLGASYTLALAIRVVFLVVVPSRSNKAVGSLQ